MQGIQNATAPATRAVESDRWALKDSAVKHWQAQPRHCVKQSRGCCGKPPGGPVASVHERIFSGLEEIVSASSCHGYCDCGRRRVISAAFAAQVQAQLLRDL